MRSLLFLLLLVYSFLSGHSQTTTQNYVLSRTYKTPVTTPASTFSTALHVEEITYFDGLGRPKQQIGVKQAGGTGYEDIVTHIGYDQYGREDKKYLPYPDATVTGGFIKTNAEGSTRTYYYNNYMVDFSGLSALTSNPFSQTNFEASALNRPLEQGSPGKDWMVNTSSDLDNTVKFTYSANVANEVRRYTVTLSSTYQPTLFNPYILSSYYYPEGQLYKSITKDENWKSNQPGDIRNFTIEEFKDKQGRIVLKRTYNAGTAHDTYYVYDDYGNLTYVIPPQVNTADGVSALELSELCYQYRYDHRNRLIEKKIPGKGIQTNWESIVYNKLDQPIMTQDPNLKTLNQWLFTKYDAFGRVVYTGLVSRTATRATLQAEADSNSVQFEERSAARTLGGTSIYYTNNAYPISLISEVHSENYYDTYLASSAQAGIIIPTTNTVGETIITAIKGLPTVSKVRVLGTANWITTVNAYEKKGRLVWSKSINPYLSTTDLVETDIDFMGNVLANKTTHSKTGHTTIVTTDNFTYDHVNRLKKHTQTLNGRTEVIAENTYSKTGELISKGVGNIASSSARLQTVNYSYNIRGWLKQINNPSTLDTDLFSFKLNYNTTEMGISGVLPLYNGNISETIWRTANTQDTYSQRKRGYAYQYDHLNRITAGHFRRANSTGSLFNEQFNDYNVSGITYDKNGNIGRLNRRGVVNTNNGIGDMDKLSYFYDGISNRLKIVSDTGNDTYGFKDDLLGTTTDTSQDYYYDLNGNLTSDANKGITSITYNHLNLPELVTIGGQTIDYTYDAAGVKLRKAIPGKITDYAGNFIYEGGALKFFSHPEGYVSYDGGQFNYVYNYVDHLGNIRLSYTDGNGNGAIDPSTEIVQEKNYYPFGLTHQGYNTNGSPYGNDAAKRYGFGGKELQSENISGNILDWYDVSARNYDPALGRWMNIDPLAELMRRHSPYNFAFDNPIFFIDPDGMIPFGNNDDPPTVYSGPGVAVGNNVTNQLDEVVITVNGNGTVATGTAQGTHVATTDTGTRLNGYKAEGQVEGDNGKINGSVSGFSAGYDGYTEPGGAHGSASAYGVSANTVARLGTEDNNLAIEGEGSAFIAEVVGDAGLYTGENDKYGVELGGEAGVYALDGSFTPSLSIKGLKIGFTVGGSVGSAHIGGRVAGTFDSSTNEGEGTVMWHAGFIGGLKFGFSISNTSQEVNGGNRR